MMNRICDADAMQEYLEEEYEGELDKIQFSADWIYRFIELFAKPVWTSVEERLPKENGKYIVCNRSGNVYQTKFYTYPERTGGHWGQKDKGKNIIAWMPMPEVILPIRPIKGVLDWLTKAVERFEKGGAE